MAGILEAFVMPRGDARRASGCHSNQSCDRAPDPGPGQLPIGSLRSDGFSIPGGRCSEPRKITKSSKFGRTTRLVLD